MDYQDDTGLIMRKSETSVALWAYPWDIARIGIPKTVARLVRARVSDLSVATVYHSGQILSLVNGEPRIFYRGEGPLWDFRQSFWREEDLTIEPSLFYQELSEALSGAGIRLRGWTIVNHDQKESPLVENAFGQKMPHAACPTAGQARFRDLVSGLLAMGVFSGLDLESIGFTKAFHGAHHDIMGVPMTPLLQLLLSWCFCSTCEETIGVGIDWQGFREQTKADLKRLLGDDTAPENGMVELATYLVRHPRFTQLIAIRGHWLQTLANDIVQRFPDLPMATLLTSYEYQSQLSWLEGISLNAAWPGDVIALGYAAPDVIRRDLAGLMRDCGWDASRLILGQSLLGTVVSSWEEAHARVQTALTMGIRRFSFYNYGILNASRWGWLEKLSSTIWQEK